MKLNLTMVLIAGGAAALWFLVIHPPKSKLIATIAGATGATPAVLNGYDYNYLRAWFGAIKGTKDAFTLNGKRYSAKSGTAIA